MLDMTELRNELNNDPTGLGYAAHIATGNHGGLAALINAIQGDIFVTRLSVTATEILHAIQPSAYIALAAPNRAWVDLALSVGQLDPGNANMVAGFGFFPVGPTRTALQALAQRTGSRAEELFGRGTFVTVNDVGAAL